MSPNAEPDKCNTTKAAAFRSRGNCDTNSLIAFRPPAEAPILITKKGFSFLSEAFFGRFLKTCPGFFLDGDPLLIDFFFIFFFLARSCLLFRYQYQAGNRNSKPAKVPF